MTSTLKSTRERWKFATDKITAVRMEQTRDVTTTMMAGAIRRYRLSGRLRPAPDGGGDCNDSYGSVYPGAPERCDDRDTDCDTLIDNGCDDDGDDWCDADLLTAGTPAVCQHGGSDCNDSLASVHPNAEELCNDADESCDGISDEGCDDDDDGWCDASLYTVGTPQTCLHGTNDCNDADPATHPNTLDSVTPSITTAILLLTRILSPIRPLVERVPART